MFPTKKPRAGFSLIELLISSGSAVLLLGGISSALYLSSQAINPDPASMQTSRAAEVLARLRDDLRHATSFTELSDQTVSFQVPDRDGDGDAENLRYSWSGAAGDPLVYEYNATGAQTLLASVQEFELTSLTRQFLSPGSLSDDQKTPLLFVVGNANSLTENEALQQSMFEFWGYQVALLSSSSTPGEIAAAVNSTSVVVLSGNSGNASNLGTQLRDFPVGIVCQTELAIDDLNMADVGSLTPTENINLVLNGHQITQNYRISNLAQSSVEQTVPALTQAIAPGALTLATVSHNSQQQPCLLAIDVGQTLLGGAPAPGRRVMTPFSGSNFNVTHLSTHGQTLLRSCVDWAAQGGNSNGVRFLGFEQAIVSNNVSQIDVPTPSSAEGDLLIAAVVVDGNQLSSLAPSEPGWTELQIAENDGNLTLGIWWRLASAGEPSSYRFTHASSQSMFGWVMRFDGNDPTNPINAFATKDSDSASPESQAFDTTVDNAFVLQVLGVEGDDVNTGVTGLVGYNTITMDGGVGNAAVSGGAGFTTQATAGEVEEARFQLTRSSPSIVISIAITPEDDS